MKKKILISSLVVFLLVLGTVGFVFARPFFQKEVAEQESEISEIAVTEVEDVFTENSDLENSTENVLYEALDENNTPTQTTSVADSKTNDSPYYIKVNRQMNCVTVYSKDSSGNYTVPVKAMVCSVGLNNRTPLGIFKTSDKYAWRALYGGTYGQYAFRIKGAILFHSVPYYFTDKGALKSEEYNKLGQAASMGCVRLSVKDAKWLVDNCPSGTKVEIYDSPDPGPLGKPSPIMIDLNSPYKGWDPTDPDPSNPWRNSKPVIIGVSDKTIERGVTVDCLSGIYAIDYAGNYLQVNVSTNLDVNVVGDYVVYYSAIDYNGQITYTQATFYVRDTIAPTIEVIQPIEVTDDDYANINSVLLSYVNITDAGQHLDQSYLSFSMEQLVTAMKWKQYGTYTCFVTARDPYGNQTLSISFQVVYKQKETPGI